MTHLKRISRQRSCPRKALNIHFPQSFIEWVGLLLAIKWVANLG